FLEDAPSANGFATFLALHFNSIFNGIGLITAAFVFSFLGIRPLLVFLTSAPQKEENPEQIQNMGENLLADNADSLGLDSFTMDAAGGGEATAANKGPEFGGGVNVNVPTQNDAGLNSLAMREIQMKEHLDKMVAQSEERAAIAIKKWLKEEAKA
ncbi:MAG: hypothetical protein AB8B49_03610, partial [Nitratireductor sp.]